MKVKVFKFLICNLLFLSITNISCNEKNRPVDSNKDQDLDSIDYYASYLVKNHDKLKTTRIIHVNSKNDEVAQEYITIPDELIKQISYCNKIINKFPNRLDYHTTKSYILLDNGKYDEFLLAIDEILLQSTKNKIKWNFSNNEDIIDERRMFLGLGAYIEPLAGKKNKNGVLYTDLLADLLKKYYPNHPDSYYLRGFCADLNQQYDVALENLNKAYSLQNNDDYLYMIFKVYVEKENSKKAKETFDKIKKFLHEDQKQEFLRLLEVIKN